MNILKKIWKQRFILRSLLHTIYFNFHYLPIKQAYKLPIFFYKPVFLSTKGKVILNVEKLKTGMIRMGFNTVSLYPNSGIKWENLGGTVVFTGSCSIGNDSSISVGKSGNLKFGKNFKATCCLKLVSYCSVKFGDDTLVAWEVTIFDTSFHKLKDLDGKVRSNTMDSICIGNNNWLTTKCIVLKGTKTPDNCVFGVNSILNKDYSKFPSHILLAGNPLEIKADKIWRDPDDDGIF